MSCYYHYYYYYCFCLLLFVSFYIQFSSIEQDVRTTRLTIHDDDYDDATIRCIRSIIVCVICVILYY
jgi:hypothetical protein